MVIPARIRPIDQRGNEKGNKRQGEWMTGDWLLGEGIKSFPAVYKQTLITAVEGEEGIQQENK